jgi:esterase/lipase
MNKNLPKTIFILGTITAISAGAAVLLSKKENRKKVKDAAEDLSEKANHAIKELEKDYQDLTKNFDSYTKTREYKSNIQNLATSSKEVIKQINLIKDTTVTLLNAFKKLTDKSIN